MGKIIVFFNHKGGVGKTTLVHNLGFILADKGLKILLVDADPQMNLTAAVYGLSTSIEYSADEDSKWSKYTKDYISLSEHLNIELKGTHCSKKMFRVKSKKNKDGLVDLISGDINLANVEADLYGIVKNKNTFTDDIPFKFESSISKKKSDYDFILIDTSPSGSSVINAMMMLLSDYFIAPVSPTFFSLQAIDNLSAIFQNWINLLSNYQTTKSFKGLSFQPKFLGLVVQMAKRFNGGSENKQKGTSFSKAAEKWIANVNESVKRFQTFAAIRNMAVSEEQFRNIFGAASNPFIIQTCCDFTNQLRSIAEKAGIPVVHLTQDICNKYKDPSAYVDITKPDGQYKISFDSIFKSYNTIADDLICLISSKEK